MMNITWTDYIDDILGTWEKRDCPGGLFECRGSVKISGKRFLFIPHDRRLRAVEAEPA